MKTNLILFEDEHLLVVNKPAGMNTHAASPYGSEGIYDWLRHREPRWATLAIVHRLDKETSGVMVFPKTRLANQSLTRQFADRQVDKRYLLMTDSVVPKGAIRVESAIIRSGDRYLSRPLHAGGEWAATRFTVVGSEGSRTLVKAVPETGRTHQIRVHAAAQGFPILGDVLYGGTPAGRVFLHAEELLFEHPQLRAKMTFQAPADFPTASRFGLRAAMIDDKTTNAFRVVHGAADGEPDWYVDRLGNFLLSQTSRALSSVRLEKLEALNTELETSGIYQKELQRHLRGRGLAQSSPRLLFGHPVPREFTVKENGLEYWLSFSEGNSAGLFLDQRDNRRRILANHVAAGFPLFGGEPNGKAVLNTFAYTCGFSVCAAKAGAQTTSVDLSRKYLDWGKRNFVLNGLNPDGHDFLFGDVFDWLRRFGKKGRRFDLIILDPPTFSQSKVEGLFRVEKDYHRLVRAALELLRRGGVLFAATNAATVRPEKFVETVSDAVSGVGRRILAQHYVPQPPDFPITREEPGYLKTMWLRVE